MSALLLAHAPWWDGDASRWLAVFDRVDLVELHRYATKNRAAAQPHDGIYTILFTELARAFAPRLEQWRDDHPSTEKRHELSPAMVEVLRRARVDEATGEGEVLASPAIAALRRRGLVAPQGRKLTAAGLVAARELAA